MRLSNQAWTILVTYVILFVILVILLIGSKQFDFKSVFALLFFIGYIALITYDTNCLTTGYCDVWSWVRTVFKIIIPIIIIIFLSFALFQKQEDPKKQ